MALSLLGEGHSSTTLSSFMGQDYRKRDTDGEPVPRTLRLRLARLAARGIAHAPLGGCVLRKICREGVLLAIRQAEGQRNGG